MLTEPGYYCLVVWKQDHAFISTTGTYELQVLSGVTGIAGGDNNADGAFSAHLRDTSLVIEGESLVDAGRLSAEVRAAYRRD